MPYIPQKQFNRLRCGEKRLGPTEMMNYDTDFSCQAYSYNYRASLYVSALRRLSGIYSHLEC